MIYILDDFSTTNVVKQATSGSYDVYTDAICPITCHSYIYGTHHFRAGGQELLPPIILQGLHWWINAGPCALNMTDILLGDYSLYKITRLVDSCCIVSEIKSNMSPTLWQNPISDNCDLNEEWIWRGQSKSSWYAWVCPPGHSPLGSSTSFVSGAGRQECVSNVHMNKCSSMTFPHVKQEGVL